MSRAFPPVGSATRARLRTPCSSSPRTNRPTSTAPNSWWTAAHWSTSLKHALPGASIVDRLVRQRPEVAADSGRTGRCPRLLRQEQRNHLLRGVRAPRRAQAAVPAVAAGRKGHVLAPVDNRHAEAPAVAVEVAGDEARDRLLFGRELVGGHEFDRVA